MEETNEDKEKSLSNENERASQLPACLNETSFTSSNLFSKGENSSSGFNSDSVDV